MAHTPAMPPNRRVEFKKGGWGAAILTTVLAIATWFTAGYIHTQTYKHPRDVMMRQRGTAPAHGAATEHGAAPAGEHGAAQGGEHGAAPAAGDTAAKKAAH